MNKSGKCFQLRSELLMARMFFFSVAKGASTFPRYWELNDDACSTFETGANTPHFSYPYGEMNFHRWVGN
jgi:hypothetical protein